MRRPAGQVGRACLRAYPQCAHRAPVRGRTCAPLLRGATVLVSALLLVSPTAGQSPEFAPPANAAQDEPADVSQTLQLIPTRQTTFAIPFSLEQLAQRPSEVQLYVSVDRGTSWTLYARQTPDAGQFTFRAGGDGEYWFALHTVFAENATPPPKSPPVELKVLVDTRPPLLNFSAKVGSAGEVVASWQAEDKNLVADTLRVQYQAVVIGGQDSTWNDVAIDTKSSDDEEAILTGSMKWWPRIPATMMNVRAEIRDIAGNVQVITRRVYLPKNSKPKPDDKVPPSSDNDEVVAKKDPGELWTADATDSLPGRSPSSTELPQRSTLAEQPSPRDPAPPRRDRFASSDIGSPDVRDSSFRRELRDADSSRPSPDRVPAAGSDLRDGIVPRSSRSRRFNLSYDVQAVGPEGVATVTLWATRDGGRSWYEWGKDEDRQSPYLVEVDADGVYGFSIVVAGHNGLSGEPPRSGDLADLWVAVDTTRPVARLVAAPFGSGRHTGHLVIRWQAEDLQLASRPITLLFSTSAEGPWTPIAAGLPNSGEHAWPVDARIPPQVYLRLEVRDKAGNVAIDQLSRPIDLSAMIPRGEIRGFEPLNP